MVKPLQIETLTYEKLFQLLTTPAEPTPELQILNVGLRALCPIDFLSNDRDFVPASYLIDSIMLLEIVNWHCEVAAHQLGVIPATISQLDDGWAVTFSTKALYDSEWYDTIDAYPFTARAETLQLAIARAAFPLVKLFSLPQKGHSDYE